MRNKTMPSVIIGLLTLILVFSGYASAQNVGSGATSTADTLRSLIDVKSQELRKIQEEREVVEKTVNEINQTKNTLVREIKTIDYNVSQLNLSVKANKITLEKLDLEIESAGESLQDIEIGIQRKRETVIKFLIALQEKDRENLFHILLRNKSLAASVSEAQSIALLNQGLISSVGELRNLQSRLSETITEQQQKKKTRKSEQITLVNRQYIVQDQKAEKQRLLTLTQDKERIFQQQIDELDKKQEEIGEIIEQFENQLRASFDPSILPLKRPGVIGFPVALPIVTQLYGKTKFAERAYRTKFHNGIDFGVPIGTPIVSALQGKVIAVDNNDRGTSRLNKFQYGKYIVIQHDNNLSTLYAHLSRATVQKGDVVQQGEVIGYSGNTGYAVGAHLHLTIFWAPSVQFKAIPPAAGRVPIGITIDPKDYLPNL